MSVPELYKQAEPTAAPSMDMASWDNLLTEIARGGLYGATGTAALLGSGVLANKLWSKLVGPPTTVSDLVPYVVPVRKDEPTAEKQGGVLEFFGGRPDMSTGETVLGPGARALAFGAGVAPGGYMLFRLFNALQEEAEEEQIQKKLTQLQSRMLDAPTPMEKQQSLKKAAMEKVAEAFIEGLRKEGVGFEKEAGRFRDFLTLGGKIAGGLWKNTGGKLWKATWPKGNFIGKATLPPNTQAQLQAVAPNMFPGMTFPEQGIKGDLSLKDSLRRIFVPGDKRVGLSTVMGRLSNLDEYQAGLTEHLKPLWERPFTGTGFGSKVLRRGLITSAELAALGTGLYWGFGPSATSGSTGDSVGGRNISLGTGGTKTAPVPEYDVPALLKPVLTAGENTLRWAGLLPDEHGNIPLYEGFKRRSGIKPNAIKDTMTTPLITALALAGAGIGGAGLFGYLGTKEYLKDDKEEEGKARVPELVA